MDRSQKAQAALITTAVALVTGAWSGPNADLWREVLTGALKEVGKCSAHLKPVRDSAVAFVSADGDRARAAELVYLQRALRKFYEHQASSHWDALKSGEGAA